jgi:hypothetical protein
MFSESNGSRYILRLVANVFQADCCLVFSMFHAVYSLWFLLQAARSQGVDCIVAPYEADAQLAYLNKAGIVQAVITEDSDLLAFGCKKVLNCSDYVLLFCVDRSSIISWAGGMCQ